jgi:hypothetical protein
MAPARYRFLWILVLLTGTVFPSRGYSQVDSGDAVSSGARAWDSLRKARTLHDSGLARMRVVRDSSTRAGQARLAAARDSGVIRARAAVVRDSFALRNSLVLRDSLREDSLRRDTGAVKAILHPVKPRTGSAPSGVITKEGIPRISFSNDLLFYVLLTMLLWLGILRSGYEKYYHDLFTVFFRSSLRQHQIREQLLQARLPSLLYNLFFIGCAGTFLYLLAASHAIRVGASQWQLWLASVAVVALLYIAKFVGLKLSGWIFGMSVAVDTYIFIVFLVNKILGVALLPVVILLAFSREPVRSASATLGVLLVAGMLIYRFIRSYRPVWEEVQMSRFHFFLYLCTFEIAPLLLIYKSMLKLL